MMVLCFGHSAVGQTSSIPCLIEVSMVRCNASVSVVFRKRLNLTLDYTQGCTFGVPDDEHGEVNANRSYR